MPHEKLHGFQAIEKIGPQSQIPGQIYQEVVTQYQKGQRQQYTAYGSAADPDVHPEGGQRRDQTAQSQNPQRRHGQEIGHARIGNEGPGRLTDEIGFQGYLHNQSGDHHRSREHRAHQIPPLVTGEGFPHHTGTVEQLLNIGAQSLRQSDQCLCVQVVLLGLPGGHRLPGHMEPLRQLFLSQSCTLAQPPAIPSDHTASPHVFSDFIISGGGVFVTQCSVAGRLLRRNLPGRRKKSLKISFLLTSDASLKRTRQENN